MNNSVTSELIALAAWQVFENWDKPYPEAFTDSNPRSADTLCKKTRRVACTLALPIVLSLCVQTHYLKTSRPLTGGIDKFAVLVAQ